MGVEGTETQRKYDSGAKFYELRLSLMEKLMKRDAWRQMLWSEAKGSILEVGVGTGANTKYYPNGRTVTAIDFSSNMLEIAKTKATKYDKKVDFRLADVQALDFEDETFDTIVTTCVFCSVPDPVLGLTELKRVLKKDGRIIMLEHVKSKNKLLGSLMDLLNPIWVRITGVNINRDTIGNITTAGLKVETERNLKSDIWKFIRCFKPNSSYYIE